MKIKAELQIETRTRDGLTIEWVGITMTAPGMTDATVLQAGMGETEGAVHKALQDVMRMFREINGIKTSEMTSGEDGYTPRHYSRHGLPGGIGAR